MPHKNLLMTNIKMLAVWLSRIRHCRGFGVQSPSAYAFIRYVINEHYPYYAYDDLARRWPHIKGTRLKMCRLYLRLANWAQADRWMWCGTLPEAERTYVAHGCRHTAVDVQRHCPTTQAHCPGATAHGAHGAHEGPCRVAVIAVGAPEAESRRHMQAFVHGIGEQPHDKAMLVIEGIGYDRVAKALWRTLVADRRVSVSYDLYYCGIAFFDGRFKQNYIVNF